jgi:endonuclease III
MAFKMMPKKTVAMIFQAFAKENPHPASELRYRSAFELLVAVMLSAQTTDKRVNIITKVLFKAANTPSKILKLGEVALKKIIRSIGLYNTKAKNLLKTCHILEEQFNGEVPDNRKALESLPGVGRKTANIILNAAFGELTIAVDTHVFRVANRTGLAKGKTPLSVEKKLMKVIPERYLKNAHYWLVLHGRYVCLARNPKCKSCLIQKYCHYSHKNL